uniref:Uncharacterized protein n=1 Tax=Myripristis murdjan TaxID=586833 RepID=A0A667XRD3_9TELE
MAAALFAVHRGGCTYLLWFWFGPPSPLLPFLYAVMQADVGLFCCVLLSLSPLPPDYIPTSYREEKKKKKKLTSYAVHGLRKRKKALGILSYANLFYSCSESCLL